MAMSQGRQYTSTRQTTYRREERSVDARRNFSDRENAYVQGNTVRRADVQRRNEEHRRPELVDVRKKAQKKKMSFSYVLFLAAAMSACAALLIGYISLNSEVTSSVKKIAALESTLNDLKLENDEEYSRIVNSVNLEDIKKKAIGTLGMTYAKEGQVISYVEQDDDYIRQVADIPNP